jgi:PIN domain nuclease of toxin-antitoxin system
LVINDYLLDTHVLHWLNHEPKRIPTALLEQLSDPRRRVFASSINAWEMRVKHGSGNWPEVKDLLDHYATRLLEYQLLELPITSRHVHELGVVPLIARADNPTRMHNDPFDRMLIAQSLSESLTLLTIDQNIHAYKTLIPLSVIWDNA